MPLVKGVMFKSQGVEEEKKDGRKEGEAYTQREVLNRSN